MNTIIEIERCNIIPYEGFRELIYGYNNRILGYWQLGKGINIFTDSIKEYINKV